MGTETMICSVCRKRARDCQCKDTPFVPDDGLLLNLQQLCLQVALLDDAGLPLEHKTAIARARNLRERLPR